MAELRPVVLATGGTGAAATASCAKLRAEAPIAPAEMIIDMMRRILPLA